MEQGNPFFKEMNLEYRMYLKIKISDINCIVKVPAAVLLDADHENVLMKASSDGLSLTSYSPY